MNETQRIAPAPIRKVLRVRAPREKAFRVFSEMGSWWTDGHSVIALLQQTQQKDVVIEPRTGGRWYEVGANGNEYDWGRVIDWDPPSRLLLCWQLGADFEYHADLETTVEVTFEEDGEFTLVHFEHRNLERFGEAAAQLREGMDGGWGELLAGFTAKAEA